MIDFIATHWLLTLICVIGVVWAFCGWAVCAIIPVEEDYDPYA